MSISDRLDEAEHRADAATEGPWVTGGSVSIGSAIRFGTLNDPDDPSEPGVLLGEVAYGDNAEFIAHARTDVPALVAALRAVLDLHKPFTWTFGYGPVESCMECAERGKPEPEAQWPCPTVRAIATALGCGDGIDTTPERVHETGKSEHIQEARNGQ